MILLDLRASALRETCSCRKWKILKIRTKWKNRLPTRIMKNHIYHIFLSFFCIFLTGNKVQALDPIDYRTNALRVTEERYDAKEITNQRIGKEIFQANCSVCHIGGANIIIPEKNLKKNTLEANGMNTVNAISYQIINGKNGMPAFGGRLEEDEIEIVASYVLKQSLTNFAEN